MGFEITLPRLRLFDDITSSLILDEIKGRQKEKMKDFFNVVKML